MKYFIIAHNMTHFGQTSLLLSKFYKFLSLKEKMMGEN